MKATDRLPRSLRRLTYVLAGWLVGAAVCLAQQAMPGKITVADVIVPPGDFGLPNGRIASIVKTRAGSDFSQAALDDDVRDLYATRAFANVAVTKKDMGDGKVNIYFWLTPLPSRVEEIVYNGANHLKADELETVCNTSGLRKGMALNPIAAESARQAILRKYQEMGRIFSSVELAEGRRQGDTRVVFNVTEGPIVRLTALDFTGNDFVPDGRLRTQVNSSRAILGLVGGVYNPGMVDNDVSILEKYYKSYGFQDASVTRELIWAPDQRTVAVRFHIHQGMRYRVAGIQVAGNKTFESDRLLDLVHLKPGQYYDQNVVQADSLGIKTLYGNSGRDVGVQERLIWMPNGTPGEVTVNYEVIERPPFTVGEVQIIGNTTTKDNVIRRVLGIYPGQVLTYPDLKRSEAALNRLNIFEADPSKGQRPTVTVLDEDSENPVKNILVQVDEARTGSLLFGLGVNSDAGLTGSIVLNERNFDILRPPTSFDDLLSGKAFRGAGQEFRLEAVPGTQLQRYTASWQEPSFLDSPYSLGVSGYYYTRSFNEDNETRLGGRVTVGRRINDSWRVSAALRVEQVGIHNVLSYAPPDILKTVGDNFLIGLRAGVTYDTRNSFLRPTEGTLVETSVEQVTGDYTFPVVSIEGNQYFTLYERADGSGRHVLAARSQAGYAGSHTPFFERFYAGGFRSMRGFEFRGIAPEINGFKVGGDFIFLNSLEYQIPILANDQLYAVTFVDTGTVESKLEINSYRVAAGFGLRIVVPMLGPVPIALDFGFPIVKANGDREQIFSFWLGFFH